MSFAKVVFKMLKNYARIREKEQMGRCEYRVADSNAFKFLLVTEGNLRALWLGNIAIRIL